ncbi:MAG: threonine synthase [Bacteroidota bacterium]
MKFYSTAGAAPAVDLEAAVIRGLAPDGGLYMPERIAPLPDTFFNQAPSMDFKAIARTMAGTLLQGAIDQEVLDGIIEEVITFDAPLVEVEPGRYALELFHGPTLAFKDFGARFLSRMLGYFASRSGRSITILVATSGDTGSAVAHGFLNTPGIRVVILYPSGKVSELQEKQFTTLGGNITALEVDGTFDDCQRLVKQAFSDPVLQQELFLASANSINIARLIPQSFYYGYAWSRLADNGRVVCSVPSGNFGNLTAGLIARRLGFPIDRLIASTNVNDVVPAFLSGHAYQPRPSVSTISNAMDVGNPSNFDRILALYKGETQAIRADVSGYAFSDEQTGDAMRRVLAATGYLMDPHGAVGWLGLEQFEREHGRSGAGVFLETAHPAKFLEAVESVTGTAVALPPALLALRDLQKKSIPFGKEYGEFRDWLRAEHR